MTMMKPLSVVFVWLFAMIMVFMVLPLLIFSFIVLACLILSLVLSLVIPFPFCLWMVFRLFSFLLPRSDSVEVRFNVTRPLTAVSRDLSEFVSDPGSGVVPAKELRISDSGERVLVVVGKRDVCAEVQSWKDSCDISLVFARLKAGDSSALNQRKGEFIDATVFPKNNREMLNQVIAGRRLFDSLDPELKKRFDGSFEKWFSSYGDKEWYSKMGVPADFLSSEAASVDDPKPVEPVVKE